MAPYSLYELLHVAEITFDPIEIESWPKGTFRRDLEERAQLLFRLPGMPEDGPPWYMLEVANRVQGVDG